MRPPSPPAYAGGRGGSEDAGRFEAAAAAAAEGTGRPCDGPRDDENNADSCVSDAGCAALLLPTVVDDIEGSDSEYDGGDSGGEAATSCRQGSESAAGSDAEAQRWHRRKELNRIAAQKCRRRRKEKAQNAQVEVSRLLTMNSQLKWKLSELLTAKSRLCDLVKSHFGDATVDELIRTVSL